MRTVRGWIGLSLLLLLSCAGADSFIVTLVFPEQGDAKSLARSVRVLAITPAELADCAALIDGSASAGDAGYEIEDEVDFGMPIQEEPRPLQVQQAGRRLFYAEAQLEDDSVFVRGCTEAEAGGSGLHQVLVQLQWISFPCDTDSECDDSNQCTDDDCFDHMCRHTNGDSGANCDDGLYCTTDDACDGSGNCTGDARDCSGLNSQCLQGVCDDDADACTTEPANEGLACDDGVFCTTGETCQAGACGGGALTDCDDGVGCTVDSCSLQDDACHNDPNDSLCDDGVGCTADSCDTQADCKNLPNAGGCPTYNIGPAADTCPHDDGVGQTTVCDFEGATGRSSPAARSTSRPSRTWAPHPASTRPIYLSLVIPKAAGSTE